MIKYLNLPASEFEELLQQIEKDCDEMGDNTPMLVLHQTLLEEWREEVKERRERIEKMTFWKLLFGKW